MDAQQRLLLEAGHEIIAAAASPSSTAKVRNSRPLADAWQKEALSACTCLHIPPYLGLQAASAGVQAAGNLASTGVYVGISYGEYAQLSAARASSVSTYTATGGSLSVAAGVLLCA